MISRSKRPQFDVDDLVSQLPRVLRFELLDGFAFFDGLTGLSDLSLIDGLTGLTDLTFDDFAGLFDLNSMDDLDLMRFSHNFQFFMTHCIGSRQFLGVSGAVFRGSAI